MFQIKRLNVSKSAIGVQGVKEISGPVGLSGVKRGGSMRNECDFRDNFINLR